VLGNTPKNDDVDLIIQLHAKSVLRAQTPRSHLCLDATDAASFTSQ
jgi:hypothetical protein